MTNNTALITPSASLMTVKEVADVLQIGTNKVYTLAREGKIPHLRLGTAYRFSAAALGAWIEQVGVESLRV